MDQLTKLITEDDCIVDPRLMGSNAVTRAIDNVFDRFASQGGNDTGHLNNSPSPWHLEDTLRSVGTPNRTLTNTLPGRRAVGSSDLQSSLESAWRESIRIRPVSQQVRSPLIHYQNNSLHSDTRRVFPYSSVPPITESLGRNYRSPLFSDFDRMVSSRIADVYPSTNPVGRTFNSFNYESSPVEPRDRDLKQNLDQSLDRLEEDDNVRKQAARVRDYMTTLGENDPRFVKSELFQFMKSLAGDENSGNERVSENMDNADLMRSSAAAIDESAAHPISPLSSTTNSEKEAAAVTSVGSRNEDLPTDPNDELLDAEVDFDMDAGFSEAAGGRDSADLRPLGPVEAFWTEKLRHGGELTPEDIEQILQLSMNPQGTSLTSGGTVGGAVAEDAVLASAINRHADLLGRESRSLDWLNRVLSDNQEVASVSSDEQTSGVGVEEALWVAPGEEVIPEVMWEAPPTDIQLNGDFLLSEIMRDGGYKPFMNEDLRRMSPRSLVRLVRSLLRSRQTLLAVEVLETLCSRTLNGSIPDLLESETSLESDNNGEELTSANGWYLLSLLHTLLDSDDASLSCLRRTLSDDPYHADAIAAMFPAYLNSGNDAGLFRALAEFLGTQAPFAHLLPFIYDPDTPKIVTLPSNNLLRPRAKISRETVAPGSEDLYEVQDPGGPEALAELRAQVNGLDARSRAVAVLRLACRISPQDPNILTLLGALLIGFGTATFPSATAPTANAAASAEIEAESVNVFKDLLKVRTAQLESARAAYMHGRHDTNVLPQPIELTPEFLELQVAAAHNQLGVALFNQETPEHLREAIVHFAHATELVPAYVRAHVNTGLAQFRLGHHREAAVSYLRGLRALLSVHSDGRNRVGDSNHSEDRLWALLRISLVSMGAHEMASVTVHKDLRFFDGFEEDKFV